MSDILDQIKEKFSQVDPYQRMGRVLALSPMWARVSLPEAFVGEGCDLRWKGLSVAAEVVSIREDGALVVPLQSTHGLSAQALAFSRGRPIGFGCGESLLGRVVDPLGNPLDQRPPAVDLVERPLWASPPTPLQRLAVDKPLATGIRMIDALTPLAMGQRIGVMAPAGVGKSTLLGRLARAAKVDRIVIALCGERGREIQDFATRELAGYLEKTVVIAAAADAPPMTRVACALAAHTAAEFFRDEGHHVLLLVDSLTRVARAQREVGLAAGEPPTRRGFPPSVPQLLGRLVERAANSAVGTLSAVYTVLVEGDDPDDPIAEEARSLLDGHLWLSRSIAERGRFPAIDPLRSLSRVGERLRSPIELNAAVRLRALLSAYEAKRDLIAIGAYERGRDPLLDEALRRMPQIETFLQQDKSEQSTWEESGERLLRLIG
jgi:FliI/YscN family ATPase